MNAGIALSNAQKYAEAADKFGAVCQQQPNFVEAQSVYGFCLLRAGKVAEADAALTKAYQLIPSRPMTPMNLASAKQREGQLQQAIDLLEQFLRADPKGEYAGKAKAMLQSLNRELAMRGSS